MFRLLSNARVVEGASFVAGPYCAMLAREVRGGMRRPKFRRSNDFVLPHGQPADWLPRYSENPTTIAHSLSRLSWPAPCRSPAHLAVAFKHSLSVAIHANPCAARCLRSNSSLSCHRIRQSASDFCIHGTGLYFRVGAASLSRDRTSIRSAR